MQDTVNPTTNSVKLYARTSAGPAKSFPWSDPNACSCRKPEKKHKL
jgi:hypothetical protein